MGNIGNHIEQVDSRNVLRLNLQGFGNQFQTFCSVIRVGLLLHDLVILRIGVEGHVGIRDIVR